LKPLLGAILVVMIGCESERPGPIEPICDPAEMDAGRVAVESRIDPTRVARGSAVVYDNGAYYLFVDAQCHYWVNNPSQVWDPTHTGVLDGDAAKQVGEELHFSAWSDLRGTWSDPAGGVFDASILVFDNSQQAVICAELCGASDVPLVVKAMRDASPVIVQELWNRGEPAVSAVRAVATLGESSPGIPYVDWPLARPISDFVRTGDVGFGEGTLEDDADSVRTLKELRASFVRGDHGYFGFDMLPIKANGAYYQLYLRDTLPFEDAAGLVPHTVNLLPRAAPR
jgi:hypothetical protein